MTPAEKLAKNKPARANGRIKAVWVCRLEEIRTNLGLSTRDVAKAIGSNASNYWRIEQGAETSLTNARKIAAFFGKSIEEIWPRAAG